MSYLQGRAPSLSPSERRQAYDVYYGRAPYLEPPQREFLRSLLGADLPRSPRARPLMRDLMAAYGPGPAVPAGVPYGAAKGGPPPGVIAGALKPSPAVIAGGPPASLKPPPLPGEIPSRVKFAGIPGRFVEWEGHTWYRTTNFIVRAGDQATAQEIAELAEMERYRLAQTWLGQALPDLPDTNGIPIVVTAGPREAPGGHTTMHYDGRGGVSQWDMALRGNIDRIRNSVLPHEVTHAVLAQHFGRPVPRWADEGLAQNEESAVEQANLLRDARGYARQSRRYVLRDLFRMSEYPPDRVAFYAQGYTVVRFLIEREGEEGRRKMTAFLGEAMRTGNWERAVVDHYGFRNIQELQTAVERWLGN